MMKKAAANFEQMSPIAVKMMYYGVITALGVLIIGIFGYEYNEYMYSGDYNNAQMCIGVVQAGFSLFVQFLIGGLIFDCVKRK